MKMLLLIVLCALCYTQEAKADERPCIGHFLYDGNFAQYCYSPKLRGEWEMVWVDVEPRGFQVASFLIQKEVCLRRRMNGECWRSREKVVRVILYERRSMSLKEGVRIIGMLSGLKRSRKVSSRYRLYQRSFKRGVRIELRLHKAHERFFVGIQSRHHFQEENKAALEFLESLSIEITKPR